MWLTVTLQLANAHIGDLIAGIDVVPAADGGVDFDIEATFGLLLREQEEWAWVCHEAVTQPGAIRAPRYTRASDGTWLATVSDTNEGRGGNTLFRSPDGACSWDDVSGLEGRLVTAADFDPLDPNIAWAVTGSTPAQSAIMGSTDGGTTWQVDTEAPGQQFHGLAAAGDELMVAVATSDDGAAGHLWTLPAGGTWTEQSVPLFGAKDPTKLQYLTSEDADHFWLVVDPIGGDILIETTDGGETWSSVYRAGGEILDGALAGDALWIVVDGLDLVSIADGMATGPVEGFPLSAGLDTVDDTLYTVPLSYLVGPMLTRRRADGTFETLAFPDDIARQKECPAKTTVAEICTPLWDKLLPDLRGFDELPIDAGTITTDTGGEIVAPSKCGCSSSGTGAPWALALGALAVARRRERASLGHPDQESRGLRFGPIGGLSHGSTSSSGARCCRSARCGPPSVASLGASPAPGGGRSPSTASASGTGGDGSARSPSRCLAAPT